MKKYIHVKKEDREFLAKVFGITPRMVFNAVHFESDSELARKVRKLAMDRGGIVMVEAPEAETLFDADGYMRQYLPGGVLLEFKYSDNSCTVFVKGEERRRFSRCSSASYRTSASDGIRRVRDGILRQQTMREL